VGIEEFDEFGEIRERTGQTVDFVNDNDLDFAGSHVFKQLWNGKTYRSLSQVAFDVVSVIARHPLRAHAVQEHE
jgi:hypothetical protein